MKFTLRSPRIPSRRPVFRPTDASTGAAQTNANPLSSGLSSGLLSKKSCALEIGGPSRRDGEPQARCHRGEATFLIPANSFQSPCKLFCPKRPHKCAGETLCKHGKNMLLWDVCILIYFRLRKREVLNNLAKERRLLHICINIYNFV